MKSIMLHVNDDTGQEARLIAALAIVRLLRARLTCIQVTPVMDYVVTDPFGGMYPIASLFEKFADQAAAARTVIEARLAAEAVTAEWRSSIGNVETTIVKQAQLSDIIIVSQPGKGGGEGTNPVAFVGDVAIHARIPVLSVPTIGPTFDPAGVAMIAWDGSFEAAHAVRGAVPMLRHARAVNIVSFDDEHDFPIDGVQRYLEAHGVATNCVDHRLDGKLVGEALCLAATAQDAAYIVMGVYGHSRFREAVVGGVSRHMLSHCTVPLLMAH